ncbi:hypothetical protein [Corynebacterium sp. HMSC04H06]|uniref:hypothetical protein n=1 Tax=Corynebacterium sp. HMSC04H06 TaxID=1581050 RepID=UPI0008A15AAA|nr:hypothetical protein [Corynebacterium sp. HMSC04H06]OFS23537.1 hypothetical protein HMPREF3067_01385 [Corynebacterium sp. HMSC04H06]
MRIYHLPAQFLGVEHLALLDHITAAPVLSLPGLAHEPQVLEVSLEPLPAGWRVRASVGIIATIAADEAAAFPSLDRLRRAGLVPTTWAQCEIAEHQVEVGIYLGPDEWLVPVNTVPAQAVIVEGGQPAAVDTSRGDLPDDYAARSHACQLIVRAGKQAGELIVSTEDHVLGAIGAPADYPALTAALDAAGTRTVCARAYVADGSIAVDVPADAESLRFRPTPPALPDASAWPARPQPVPQVWDVTLDCAAFPRPTPGGRPVIGPDHAEHDEAPSSTFGPFPKLHHDPPATD